MNVFSPPWDFPGKYRLIKTAPGVFRIFIFFHVFAKKKTVFAVRIQARISRRIRPKIFPKWEKIRTNTYRSLLKFLPTPYEFLRMPLYGAFIWENVCDFPCRVDRHMENLNRLYGMVTGDFHEVCDFEWYVKRNRNWSESIMVRHLFFVLTTRRISGYKPGIFHI